MNISIYKYQLLKLSFYLRKLKFKIRNKIVTHAFFARLNFKVLKQ